MATPLAAGDIMRLRVACYTANQAGINVIHYKVSSVTGTGQTDVQAALYFDTLLAVRYKAALCAQARYRGVSIQRVLPLPPTAPAVSTAFDGVGSIAGELLPQQVSGIVTSRTNLAGVKYRGRAYIPFPGEDSNQGDSTPTGAYVTAIDDIGSELFTPKTLGLAPNQAELTPVILHRATSTWTEISGWLARSAWATQRRRGAYGKTNTRPF